MAKYKRRGIWVWWESRLISPPESDIVSLSRKSSVMAKNGPFKRLRAHPVPHLNPDTSLAFLPPTIATQLEAIRYLSVVVLGVSGYILGVVISKIHFLFDYHQAFAWDILGSLSQDYRLFTKQKFNLPTVAYFVSRFAINLLLFSIYLLTTARESAPWHTYSPQLYSIVRTYISRLDISLIIVK